MPVVIAHVSDIHIDAGPRAAERTRLVFDHLDALPADLDLVVLTGDIADHGLDSEYETVREATATRHPLLVCPGNHDDREAFRRTLLGVPASTVHAVLVRCRINRLSHIDRVTGEPIRRYEHDHPGSLIHVDVTKFGNIPDGGGWRYVGKQQGNRNRIATVDRTGQPRKNYKPQLGTAYLHTVIDDHSRVAYAEICNDEKAETAIGVLHRAVAWFADRGVTVERVLSDNGSAYRSFAWRDTCAALNITPKRTRPYRPQTNGKIERFHRTLSDGWAYARLYQSEHERRQALPGWIHFYNHHRAHSAIGGLPPISRLTNLPGHHI